MKNFFYVNRRPVMRKARTIREDDNQADGFGSLWEREVDDMC